MVRKKPYSLSLAIIDVALTLVTGGFWLGVVLIRELYYRA